MERSSELSCNRILNEVGESFGSQFMQLDQDGDGKISRKEWKAHFGTDDGFDIYDQGSDGHVNRDEYKRGKEHEALAGLVKDALGGAWSETPLRCRSKLGSLNWE